MQITIDMLCRRLAFPLEAVKQLEKNQPDFAQLRQEITGLTDPEGYAKARAALKEKLGEDPGGWKMLACMLQAMRHSYELYRQRKIPEKIFLDTMKCFPRFLGESKTNFGAYSFDRDFWTGRQLSLLLFRLGELEYEMTDFPEDQALTREAENEKAIFLHIPGDARLTPENCLASYRMARKFFADFYPELQSCRCFCESWLMSPVLKELLPADSRIVQFQRNFKILRWDRKSNEGVLYWVFGRSRKPLQELPEVTSLQRSMKRFMLEGGRAGEALAEWTAVS